MEELLTIPNIILSPEDIVLFKPVYVVRNEGRIVEDHINQIIIADNSYVNTIRLKSVSYLVLKLAQDGQKFRLVQDKGASQVFFDKKSAYEYAMDIVKYKFEEKKNKLECCQKEYDELKRSLECLTTKYKQI